MKFKKNIAAGAAAGALLLSQVGVVAAADMGTIQTTGNRSKNIIEIMRQHKSYSSQSNDSSVKNDISVSINTGENSASKNTGDGEVQSGAASVGIFVGNAGNTNQMTADDCGCPEEDTDSLIEETGNKSYNKIRVQSSFWEKFMQRNRSRVSNDFDVDVETGDNNTDKNTGNGSTTSEDAEVVIEVVNEADMNSSS